MRRDGIELSVAGDRRATSCRDVKQTSWQAGVLTIDVTNGKPLRASSVADLELALAMITDVARIAVDRP